MKFCYFSVGNLHVDSLGGNGVSALLKASHKIHRCAKQDDCAEQHMLGCQTVRTYRGNTRIASCRSLFLRKVQANTKTSVITSKPANDDHLKTGQRTTSETGVFYSFCLLDPASRVLVRQLRGPHFRT